MKTLGVIGGLGVDTGHKFCKEVARRVRETKNVQPSIVSHIVHQPVELETDLIYGKVSNGHLDMLFESVEILENAGVDRIMIPCNTVHVFIEQLRAKSKTPISSIIEETAKKLHALGVSSAAILASATTIQSGIYARGLAKHGITSKNPKEKDQEIINDLIFEILNDKPKTKIPDAEGVIRILEKESDAIVLGCTDLRLVPLRSTLPIIDSTSVLEDVAVEFFA